MINELITAIQIQSCLFITVTNQPKPKLCMVRSFFNSGGSSMGAHEPVDPLALLGNHTISL